MKREGYLKLIKGIAKEPDKLQKTLKVIAVLTEMLDPIKPVIVGGAALEFYTLGGYNTKDVDLVVPAREKLAKALIDLRFQPVGRHWYSEELDMAIEAPDEVLAGDGSRITTVAIDGRKAYVIGIEDLIIDRLNSAQYWQNQQGDFDLSVMLLLLHEKRIDLDYLKEASHREGTGEMLERALQEKENQKRKIAEAQKADGGKRRCRKSTTAHT